MTVGLLFKFKDVVPMSLLSGIVYKYKCSSCNAAYIGKSMRHLKVRASEHMGISALTNKKMLKYVHSAIVDHLIINSHDSSLFDFSVIGRDSVNFRFEVKKSLFI